MKKLSCGFIFPLVFAPLYATANNIAPQQEELTEETTVISERLQTKRNPAWSVSAISKETLKDNPPEHIQQALNSTPGMNIQRGNGAEYLPSLRSPVLTGAGACGNLLIMEQGIRLRGAGVCNINELFDAHHEQASQIEILRGPSTAFHGANSLLGAIDVRLEVSDENSASVDWGHRGFHRARLTNSYEKGNHQGTFYTTLTHDSGWRDDSGYDQQKLSWRHHTATKNWQLDPGFTVINLNQETAGFISGENAFKDRELIETNPTPEAYRDNKAARVWLHAKRDINTDTQLLVTPYFRHTDMAFLQHFLPGDPLENNRQTSLGVQTSIYQKLSTNWQINYGSDIEQSRTFLKQSQDAPTTGSAFLVATIPQGEHYNYDTDIRSLAAFAQASVEVSEHVQLSGGLRAESIEYDYTNNLPVGRTRDDGTECGFGGCRYSRPESGKDRFHNISPNVALSFDLGKAKLFASAGQNYRPPQTSELYRLQRAQSKADLDNVQTNYINTGFELSDKNVDLRVEAYHQKIKNLIIRDVDFFNVDNARANSTGLEAVWEQRLKNVKSTLVLNWARHRYGDNQFIGTDDEGNPLDVSGNDVDTAPRLFGQWQIEWQARDNLSTQLTFEYTDEYYLEPLNERRYQGHTLVHWNIVWKLNPQITLRLKVNNLLDKRYASRADYTGFSGYRYFPGEPRAFHIGVDWLF